MTTDQRHPFSKDFRRFMLFDGQFFGWFSGEMSVTIAQSATERQKGDPISHSSPCNRILWVSQKQDRSQKHPRFVAGSLIEPCALDPVVNAILLAQKICLTTYHWASVFSLFSERRRCFLRPDLISLATLIVEPGSAIDETHEVIDRHRSREASNHWDLCVWSVWFANYIVARRNVDQTWVTTNCATKCASRWKPKLRNGCIIWVHLNIPHWYICSQPRMRRHWHINACFVNSEAFPDNLLLNCWRRTANFGTLTALPLWTIKRCTALKHNLYTTQSLSGQSVTFWHEFRVRIANSNHGNANS